MHHPYLSAAEAKYKSTLARGVPVNDLPGKVIANARSRFDHLATTFKMFPDLGEDQRKRVDTLINFYNKFIP